LDKIRPTWDFTVASETNKHAAVQRGPFAHALDTVAAARVRRPHGTVVGDPHPELGLVVGDGDRRVAGLGVTQGIG
jgi:hypothetical protein